MTASTNEVAVVGAGIVGCAVAWALTKARRQVLLIDRADPATGGASFGNVGHIASEQVEPLPSPTLLLNFWRELFPLGGPLDLPLRRVITMAPWMARFARAAFQQRKHMEFFAPLVRVAADTLESQLSEVGRTDLLRRNGHYVVWLGRRAAVHAAADRSRAAALGVATKDAPAELLQALGNMRSTARGTASDSGTDATHESLIARAGITASGRSHASTAVEPSRANAAVRPPRANSTDGPSRAGATFDPSPTHTGIAAAWYPDSAHVLDPSHIARAFADATVRSGGSFVRTSVRHMRPSGDRIEIMTEHGPLSVRTAVVCAGAWSAPLLAPFGVRAPLEAERGYHVELPNHAAPTDAPIVYADHSVVVTPMASRLRATSYLEFAGLNAPPDPAKPARLRKELRDLGYQCELQGPSWMGPRPTLPDYLPGIGRARGPHELFYAVGHQHLGLTLAAVTADLVADIVSGRPPRFDIRQFDLGRFGSP
jgi:D-amino-acid dehydrogenase